MKPRENCPTCGTALGPLHDKDVLRRCTSCARVNPRGFYYCGFCAAPMESTDHRAELAEVAAPPGGWPSLTRELIEVRFFMERGEIDEAFERVAVLRERYPGHPELIEFQRGPTDGRPRPDTQVNRVVDSVLSGSSSLGEAMPRRAPPKWQAPAAGDDASEDGRTRAHEVVKPISSGKTRHGVRKKVVRANPPRRAGAYPTVAGAPDQVTAESTDVKTVVPPASPPPALNPRRRTKTDRHAGAAPVPRPGETPVERALASMDAEAETEEESTPIEIDYEPSGPAIEGVHPGVDPDDVALPQAAGNPGLTVVVPTLQPPAPFLEPGADDETSRVRGGLRKRALKARKRSGVQAPVAEGQGAEATPRRRRVRGHRFGQHVLGRLGGKDE